MEREQGAGRLAVQCAGGRPTTGIELEALSELESGHGGGRSAGVPGFRVHDLRRTAASVCVWVLVLIPRWSNGCWGTPPQR
jgi:hypothetical protein